MRTIGFHKAFLPAVIVSGVLLVVGIAAFAIQGFNLGVDFQAGVNQYVRLAYPAAEVSFTGVGAPVLSIDEKVVDVVFSGADVQARTVTFDLKTVGTIADLAVALSSEGISLVARDGSAGLSAALLVPTYQGTYVLSAAPVLIHRGPKSESEQFGSVELVRKAIADLGDASVQNIGGRSSMQFMVRLSDNGTDRTFSETMPLKIKTSLETAFGAGKVVTMRTDYVGSQFSKDLAGNSWKLVLFTTLAILAYATIRFKIQYALGAVLAILHDCLMMVGFMVLTRMEFNTTSIAAILTILGYSINDTIVIFDRIREDKKLDPNGKLSDIMDRSITQTLDRTIITTFTTMLAVLALYIFTSGSIKNFALALLVGIVSGTYSTVFVASGFVCLWDNVAGKRKPKHPSGQLAAKSAIKAIG